LLGPEEARVVLALAEALLPAGNVLDGASAATLGRFEELFAGAPASQRRGLRALIWACEVAPLATHRRRFTALDPAERERFLASWSRHRSLAVRSVLKAVTIPLKSAHLNDLGLLRRVESAPVSSPPPREESPRWLGQVQDGRAIDEDTTLDCEVVVVGTGAGGAAAAYELASRGRAVLLLEEGDYHRRGSFDGRASPAVRRFYRDQGVTVALGNVGVPVWAGRMVGGSTAINSGTCYRTPERTFRAWRERFGLPQEFSSAGLGPYFERVEAMLQVTPAHPSLLGGVGRVVSRGATAMGLHHGPLPRNAPDCDGQGACCYGCPTGAKRSTDVSYIPGALSRGAQLITAARVERVDQVAGQARGVTARLGSGRQLRVRAEAVVVAGGALMTPLLLARSGACGASGWLGRNLSIHPAAQVLALFDETIDMARGIPQGYGIDSFADEGLMFEGGSTPLDVLAAGIPWVGRPLMDLLDRYRQLATFGFMIQDTSRGTVREGPGGSPLLTYQMNRADLALMQRGIVTLAELFLRAGARRVFPFALGHEEISSESGLDRLRRARLSPGDFEVGAFHPLGTCRLGVDPRTSCVGLDQQAHDVGRLYVCDGSVMPSSLGVNPQLTIMAMALRAAERIDAALG
jgi:choline dehydrogenase-like flavoprotein